jgi:thiamine-phosphate pyrophosphorylase
MPRAQSAESKRPAPRLYLVTSPLEDAAPFVAALGDALAAADVAAVLLRLRESDERTLINRTKSLAAVTQKFGAALVLDGHAEIAARAGADGVHLTGIEPFTAAIDMLKPARIAGCGGLKTRHDAMLAAERGADYVMFGEPGIGGRRPSFDAVIERIGWWAEVFEIPCVGYAAALDEIAPLVRAGADFAAFGEGIWADAGRVADAIAAAAEHLAIPEPVG